MRFEHYFGAVIAKFEEDTFWERTIFSGHANFWAASFHAGANFNDAKFKGKTRFQRAWFRGSTPKLFQSELHQDARFPLIEEQYPKPTQATASDSKEAFSRLRHIAIDHQRPDDAHFFFRQEMRCKYYLEKGPARWVNGVFGLLSDYGHSLSRPIWGLGGVWLIAALIYGGSFYVSCQVWQTQCTSIAAPFGLSFTSLFSFLGLGRLFFGEVLKNLPGPLMALSGLQTIAGFVLLFFLGLALRNHFRLK